MPTPNSITTIKNMTIDKVTMKLEIERLKARVDELEKENRRLKTVCVNFAKRIAELDGAEN